VAGSSFAHSIRQLFGLWMIGMTAACASTAPAVSEAPRTAAAEANGQLPAWMQPIVRAQMARRWEALNELRWSAASLEFERTHQLARAIAHDVQSGHPADDAVAVTRVIPSHYLQMQGELRVAAEQLATAAQGSDSHVVAHAFDEMVQACVHCHQAYRHGGVALALPVLGSR
jgi:hypothetical protein